MNTAEVAGTKNRTSPWNTALDILVAPADACEAILGRRRQAIFPYLWLLASFSALWIYYYLNVDFAWLQQQMVEASFARAGGGATREQIAASMADLTPGVMGALVLFAGVVSISMILFARAAYLSWLARLFTDRPPGMASWLALSLWASLPSTISALISFTNLLTSDVSRLPSEEVSLTSLNAIVLHLAPTDPWARFSVSLDLLLAWNAVVMGVGFSRWTRAGWLVGQVVGFGPFLAIYGIWALVIAL